MRFRKADYDIIEVVDNILSDGYFDDDDDEDCVSNRKKWTSLVDRIRKNAAKPKTGGDGLPVRKAVDIIKGILGKRCILPAAYPLAGKVWFIQMQNKLNANAVTEQIITAAAKKAATEWKGRIRAEAIIRNVDTLLTETEAEELKAEANDMTDL